MVAPTPLGPLTQLLSGYHTDGIDQLTEGWVRFEIIGREHSAEAGSWSIDNTIGEWTFLICYGSVIFYFKEKKDAMFFKLSWFNHMKKKDNNSEPA